MTIWLPGRKRRLLAAVAAPLVLILSLGLSLTDQVACDGDADSNRQQLKQGKAPKDYSYSPKASRVREMAGFFESMQRRNLDPSSKEKQDLVISLSEAASKLHLLMDGFPLEIKCNRYVKLIDRPNIRTFGTVNLLANEDKQFNEIEQNDVNLLSRLQNERSFDALSKSQTLIQSLESERNNMRSAYENEVQQELLECINYYIYRHQRATLGLIEYVREARAKVDLTTNQPGSTRIVLDKYRELLEAIKFIERKEKETGGQKDDTIWLNEFAKMYDLLLENDFELPKLVLDFVTDPKRLERLDAFNEVLSQVDEVVKSILEHETHERTSGARLEHDEQYRKMLFKLYDMVENYGTLLPESVRKLVESPDRRRLAQDEAERKRLTGKKEEEVQQAEIGQPAFSNDDDDDYELFADPQEELPSPSGADDIEDDNFFDAEEVVEDVPAVLRSIPTIPNADAKTSLAGKYITGFKMHPGPTNNCPSTVDVALDNSQMPRSACTRHALDLSSSLRSFDDAGVELEWAKSMVESVGRFMANCLMRPSYKG